MEVSVSDQFQISSAAALKKQSMATFPARFNTTFSDLESEFLYLGFLIQSGFNNTEFPPQLILASVLR